MQPSASESPRLAYACLAVLFILTVIVQGTFTVDAVRDLLSDYPRPPVRIGRPWPSIRTVPQSSVNGAIQLGQHVIAIDGRATGAPQHYHMTLVVARVLLGGRDSTIDRARM